MQRVTLGIGIVFQVVEDEMRDTLLPALFQGATSQNPGRLITGLPLNQAGIALPSPTHTVRANWTAPCVITGHLIEALCGTSEFSLGYHTLLVE